MLGGLAPARAGESLEGDLTVDQILDREMARTQPDYIVYRTGSVDGSTFDTGNEHFLVFDGPDGSLMAVWTQSSYEGKGDHRIMLSRSEDEGVTWSTPLRIVGPARPVAGFMSSWGSIAFEIRPDLRDLEPVSGH